MEFKIDRRDKREGITSRSWHERFADPFAVTEKKHPSVESARAQADVDLAYAVEKAISDGDPVALFDAQMRPVTTESRTNLTQEIQPKADIFKDPAPQA